MNRNLLIRLVVDLAMTVLMVVVMAYHITGNAIHEVVGVVMFGLFVVHNILNRHWYKTVFRGTYHVRRVLSIGVYLLFLLSMTVVMISSVPISRDVFPSIPINDDTMLRQMHVLTAYWGFIFMAVHIGMSWGTILNAVRKMRGITGPSRVRTIAFRVTAVLIVVYGVQTSFERGMGTKLVIYDPFGNWILDDSTIGYVMDYLSMMGIYICGTHYALKFVQKHEKGKAAN